MTMRFLIECANYQIKTIQIHNQMKKVKMSLELAKQMYTGTDEALKAFALENFPELGAKITDRIKTFEDACKELGVQFQAPTDCTPDEVAYMKVKIIVRALNEGWVPNWENKSEYKYYPWFKMSSSGSGFSYVDCGFDNACSGVGSRLCFKSNELAIYAAKQFTEVYKQLLTI